MNIKSLALASLAAIVVFFGLDMVIHGILLEDIYKQTESVWRPKAELESMMWLMWLGYLVSAPLFVFFYSKGYESNKSRLGQGLRFGLYMGIFISFPMSFGWYVILPIPFTLALYWFLAGMVSTVSAGTVVGLIYKKS